MATNSFSNYNGVSAYNLLPNGIDTREAHGVYTPSAITQNSLVYSYDGANPNSYAGTGTAYNNLISSTGDLTLYGAMESGYVQNGWFNCDGVNDYAKSPTFNLFTGDFTMGVWFKQSVFDGIRLIYGQWNLNGLAGISIYYNHNVTSLIYRLEDSTGANYAELLNNSNYSLNTWYYAVYTWDNTTKDHNGYIYDGSGLVASVISNRPTLNTSSPTTNVYSFIGGDNNFYWDGDIGEAHTYSRKLTSSEILNNLENTKARYGY